MFGSSELIILHLIIKVIFYVRPYEGGVFLISVLLYTEITLLNLYIKKTYCKIIEETD